MLVSARGVRINVLEHGSGDPVILLHGVGCTAQTLTPQLEALAPTRRALAVDFRGHGASDRTYGRMSLRDYADDVLAVMSELGIDRAAVVGVSMGGMVAQAMALSAPDRVTALVLADTCARADAEMAAGMKAVGSLAATEGMKTAAEHVKPVTFCAAALVENRPYVQEFEEGFRANDPLTFGVAMAALAELDFLDDLPRITVPTLVLVGAEDVLTRLEYSEAIAAAVPGAELRVIEKAGHLSNLDQSEVFNDHLIRFLDGTRQGETA
ncbi:alpha/beta fold hydrolase [Streptomyces sp. NPDC047081]|uniref:alpha/beta fold hydrolase n=1 Tax=Streptomyces sp. NPDC047081 TaxID=3154706 RepID=UPI0033CE071A